MLADVVNLASYVFLDVFLFSKSICYVFDETALWRAAKFKLFFMFVHSNKGVMNLVAFVFSVCQVYAVLFTGTYSSFLHPQISPLQCFNHCTISLYARLT